MAKKAKAAPAAPAAVVAPAAPAAVAAPVARMPLALAKAHNGAIPLVQAGQPVAAAGVALTSKGSNTSKARVYGYSNMANGGGVPKAAPVLLVAGATLPKGVAAAQWQALQPLAGQTVAACYAAGIASRTIRRAFRAGAIRFGAVA